MKQKEKEYLIAETKARNELTETYVDEYSSWKEEFEYYRWRGGLWIMETAEQAYSHGYDDGFRAGFCAGVQSGYGKGYDDATRTAIKERWT